jgi:hypothetical protein
MYKTKITFAVTFLYLLTVVFWISFISATGYEAMYEGAIYNFLLKPFLIGMTALPILGGLFGLYRASEWGGLRSAVGKSMTLLSLGSIFWGLGMVLWNYYLFAGIEEIPYPSWADAAFILSWPMWALGVVFLSKATGVKFALRAAKGKVQLVLVPLIAIAASYYLLVVVARGGVWELDASNGFKLFFDLFYPIGTAIILAMALTFFSLSKDFLGGRYKAPITILIVAFIVNYLADFTFSYTTTYETYFNGHFVDFLFTTAMYLLVLSLSLMSPNISNEENNKSIA